MKNQTCTSFSTGQPHVNFGKISLNLYIHAKCKIVNNTNICNLWRLKGLNKTMTHWGRSPNSIDSKILLCLLLSSCMTYYLEVWCECLSSARTLAWAHNYQLSQNLQSPGFLEWDLWGGSINALNYFTSDFTLYTTRFSLSLRIWNVLVCIIFASTPSWCSIKRCTDGIGFEDLSIHTDPNAAAGSNDGPRESYHWWEQDVLGKS